MVLAILVHDGQALLAVILGAGFGDVDDAGVEIAVLASDALVDIVGDDVGCPAPDVLGEGVGVGEHLRPAEHVPQPELDAVFAACPGLHRARHQRLGIDQAPVLEARQHVGGEALLDEGALIDRRKQAGAFQVGGNDARDLRAQLIVGRIGSAEHRNRDRHRLDYALGDVDHRLGLRGRHRHSQNRGRQRSSYSTPYRPNHRHASALGFRSWNFAESADWPRFILIP
jgi:hypothetical protein